MALGASWCNLLAGGLDCHVMGVLMPESVCCSPLRSIVQYHGGTVATAVAIEGWVVDESEEAAAWVVVERSDSLAQHEDPIVVAQH